MDEGENKPTGAVVRNADIIRQHDRIIRFKGRPMLLVREPFERFVPLRKEQFEQLAYQHMPQLTRSQVSDVFASLSATAEDLSDHSHFIGFGQTLDTLEVEADTPIDFYAKHPSTVWDMKELETRPELSLADCVWRSPYSKVSPDGERVKFIMDLANGDTGLYDDIMQSIAPLVMDRKPDGIIWWVGAGANGKSTLMDALYRIFPNLLANITVKRLMEGRDAPSLNGTLANICKESSDGRIDDTEIYKSLGTHENFRVHRFHSQDDIEINGNIHTIFSANNIPVFADKGHSIKRRTFIIPFTKVFVSDPDFESKTFTPEFFGKLITEMCKYAIRLKQQGYKYKWSAVTRAAKMEYDREASNAEEYAKYALDGGLVAFSSYRHVRTDYENWCADNGFVPLGITNLRKAITAVGFERTTRKQGYRLENFYKLPEADIDQLQPLSEDRIGLYTLPGFDDGDATTSTTTQPEPQPTPDDGDESVRKWKW